MKYRWFSVGLFLGCTAVVTLPCHAESGASSPSRHFSLFAASVPLAARYMMPSISRSPHDVSRGDGYAIGFGSDERKSVSGRFELRHFDYFVDDNLKGERRRNSAVFTMRLRF